MPSKVRQSKLKQLEGLKRRLSKKPIGSGTENSMGKDRLRDRKVKKMIDKKTRMEFLRQNKKLEPMGGFRKPSLPPRSMGTGGVNRGGFRKPDTSRIRPGILSNRKKVKKGS